MNIAPYLVMVTPIGSMRSLRLAQFCRSLEETHRLAVLHDDDELLVLGAENAPRLNLPDGGLVWGHLFASGSSTKVVAQTPPTPLTEPAPDFVRQYWGGYLAIRRQSTGIEVLRDPSGEIPCYLAEIDGTHVVTSQPHLLFDAGLLTVEFDWTIIAQALAFRDLKPARTALRGVSEVLPGITALFENGRITMRCVWSPWDFTRSSDEICDSTVAAVEVKATARQCVSAWGGCYQRAVVEISGGLDSAIVAAALALDGRDPACLNFWPASGDPDERPYARAIAGELGLPLREERLDEASVDLRLSQASDSPRACARTFAQAMDRASRDLGTEIGTDAYFSGGGGDNVFCYVQSVLPVIDRFRRLGLGRGLLRTIDDAAQLAQVTVWEVMVSTARRMRRADPRLPTPRRNRFFTADACADLPWPADNPWLEAPAETLPGKARHIWSLISIHNHLEGYGRLSDAPIISPLLSQPLVELCLRIPSWLWIEAGRNRAVARNAFADILPPSVIARRSKGGFDGFGAALIDSNRALLREMLLDGELARHKLIDTTAVQRTLERPIANGEVIVELLALVDLEAWIVAWRDRRPLSQVAGA
ncbi:asparagine synthase-related protein [Sphingomonas sp. PWP1-2]|uniref:asparagine synthase-related protein n=1 Tax=Sphingomonas sp. PWP1-2 TaxID=2804558 RepID=UPI003CF7AD5F